MAPNEKSLNHKVVDLVRIYNFHIKFISLKVSYLEKENFAGWTGGMFATMHLPPVHLIRL
jgi:hypothetical protein